MLVVDGGWWYWGNRTLEGTKNKNILDMNDL